MMVYLSLKTLHVIAVFAFIAGLLIQSHVLRLYRTMPVPHMPDERRLLSRIQHWDLMVTVPALTLTWIFGLSAALHGGWFPSGWLKIKLIVVVALSMFHGLQSGELRRLSDSAQIDRAASRRPPLLIYLLAAFAVGLAVFKPW